MEKPRELQLDALDKLGNKMAELTKILDHIETATNTFDVEAKLYYLSMLSLHISTMARNYHTEMHRANSWPGEWHDDACLHGINLKEA